MGGEEGERSAQENQDGSTFSLQKAFGPDAPDRIAVPDLPVGASIKMLETNQTSDDMAKLLAAERAKLAALKEFTAEEVEQYKAERNKLEPTLR